MAIGKVNGQDGGGYSTILGTTKINRRIIGNVQKGEQLTTRRTTSNGIYSAPQQVFLENKATYSVAAALMYDNIVAELYVYVTAQSSLRLRVIEVIESNEIKVLADIALVYSGTFSGLDSGYISKYVQYVNGHIIVAPPLSSSTRGIILSYKYNTALGTLSLIHTYLTSFTHSASNTVKTAISTVPLNNGFVYGQFGGGTLVRAGRCSVGSDGIITHIQDLASVGLAGNRIDVEILSSEYFAITVSTTSTSYVYMFKYIDSGAMVIAYTNTNFSSANGIRIKSYGEDASYIYLAIAYSYNVSGSYAIYFKTFSLHKSAATLPAHLTTNIPVSANPTGLGPIKILIADIAKNAITLGLGYECSTNELGYTTTMIYAPQNASYSYMSKTTFSYANVVGSIYSDLGNNIWAKNGSSGFIKSSMPPIDNNSYAVDIRYDGIHQQIIKISDKTYIHVLGPGLTYGGYRNLRIRLLKRDKFSMIQKDVEILVPILTGSLYQLLKPIKLSNTRFMVLYSNTNGYSTYYAVYDINPDETITLVNHNTINMIPNNLNYIIVGLSDILLEDNKVLISFTSSSGSHQSTTCKTMLLSVNALGVLSILHEIINSPVYSSNKSNYLTKTPDGRMFVFYGESASGHLAYREVFVNANIITYGAQTIVTTSTGPSTSYGDSITLDYNTTTGLHVIGILNYSNYSQVARFTYNNGVFSFTTFINIVFGTSIAGAFNTSKESDIIGTITSNSAVSFSKLESNGVKSPSSDSILSARLNDSLRLLIDDDVVIAVGGMSAYSGAALMIFPRTPIYYKESDVPVSTESALNAIANSASNYSASAEIIKLKGFE